VGFYQSRKRRGNRKKLLCFLKAALQCAQFLHTFRYPPGNFNNKTKTHADPHRINVRLQYRSGETRTRGLLLPKQARYQLRNTPTSGGTAAPPEYSISFFARFVNTESAVRGIGDFRLFQPIKAAVRKRAMTGIFCKKVRFWCNCRKADAKTGQNTKFVAL
jgi:hypothetical protein